MGKGGKERGKEGKRGGLSQAKQGSNPIMALSETCLPN